MKVQRPSAEEAKSIARTNNLEILDEDFLPFQDFIESAFSSFDTLDALPEPKLVVRYQRDSGRRPLESENPYGAWAWMCSIKGRNQGHLLGKKIAIKDNVSVAGVPLLNGSFVMEDYVPDVDATIVTRILDAGGEIVGKTTCENMCVSGGSETSYPKPVKNHIIQNIWQVVLQVVAPH